MRRLPQAIAAIVLATGSTPANADVLWDNGLSFEQHLSHLSGKGQRRSIIDDFAVASEETWAVTRLSMLFTWRDLRGIPMGTDLELVFYADADGEPDFNRILGTAENRTYKEVLDHCPKFFSPCVMDISVTFDEILLPAGRYWVEMHVVAPINGFQYISDRIHGSPVWVDYEDFGGRQPGRNVFGADYDVNFILEGEVIPAPAGVLILAAVWLGYEQRRRRRDEP